MLRKVIALAVVLFMCFFLCSCGTTETQGNNILYESQTETVQSAENDSSSVSSVERNAATVQSCDETADDLVWVPTRVGKKYHIKASCCGMIEPIQVTRETAEENGFTPCKNCY